MKFFLDWAREAAEKNISPNEGERKLFDHYSAETLAFGEGLLRSVSGD